MISPRSREAEAMSLAKSWAVVAAGGMTEDHRPDDVDEVRRRCSWSWPGRPRGLLPVESALRQADDQGHLRAKAALSVGVAIPA